MFAILDPRQSLISRITLTVLWGALGSFVFFWLNLPLPWMLGALSFVLFAALAGAPLMAPNRLRPGVVAVIGVMLGSSFTPQTFDHAEGWILSLICLLLSVLISAVLVVPLFLRVGKMDLSTALFAAMPGGLAEMMEMGRQYGGDDREIVLAHAARIVLTIAVVAVWFRLVLGLEVSGVSALGRAGGLGWSDIALLLGCGVGGGWIGLRLRFPAPTFLGPMLLSALVHYFALSDASPPASLVISAQVLLGTIMGCRFKGMPFAQVARAIALSFGATLIMLGVAMVFAVLLHANFGQSPEQVLLAYAPGGMSEMSLVALSMDADVAYIATHHIARVIVLLAVAPGVLGWIIRRSRASVQK